MVTLLYLLYLFWHLIVQQVKRTVSGILLAKTSGDDVALFFVHQQRNWRILYFESHNQSLPSTDRTAATKNTEPTTYSLY